MIVTGSDQRNIFFGVDIVQAKLLLAALRRVTIPQLLEASNEVQKDGFLVFVTDAEAARSSAVSVLGQFLDTMVHVSKAAKDSGTKEPEPLAPPADDEETAIPVKVTVN